MQTSQSVPIGYLADIASWTREKLPILYFYPVNPASLAACTTWQRPCIRNHGLGLTRRSEISHRPIILIVPLKLVGANSAFSHRWGAFAHCRCQVPEISIMMPANIRYFKTVMSAQCISSAQLVVCFSPLYLARKDLDHGDPTKACLRCLSSPQGTLLPPPPWTGD